MASDAVVKEAVRKLVSAVTGPGGHWASSFMYGRPGAHDYEKRLGAELYVDPSALIEAVLFIRHHGAPYLKFIGVSELRQMVVHFLTDNYWYLSSATPFGQQTERIVDMLSAESFSSLEGALRSGPMFSPSSPIALLPLQTIQVQSKFVALEFTLIQSQLLSSGLLENRISDADLQPDMFPPVKDWSGNRWSPTSWLIVRAQTPSLSNKAAATILGAIAITPPWGHRYAFSGREMHGGSCVLNGRGYSISFPEPYTPPLMENIVITKDDHGWLSILNDMLTDSRQETRRKLNGLEYFYRAWFLDKRERFPILCMALDAIVNVTQKHTDAAVGFVEKCIDAPIDKDRLRLLLRLRGAVVHGAAPNVYEAEVYEEYVKKYVAEPTLDMELVVAECLRKHIFGDTFRPHADPHPDILVQLEAMGRKLRNPYDTAIIRPPA